MIEVQRKYTIMKRSISVLAMTCLLFAGAVGSARADTAAHERLDSRVKDFDARTKKSDVLMRDSLHAVSVETGVPEDRVIAMHQKHPNAGPAHLLLACVMADKTHRAPEYYLDDKMNGKSWVKIAQADGVSLNELDSRLARLEKHVDLGADTSKRARERELKQEEKKRL
jgi:hypothetical protein